MTLLRSNHHHLIAALMLACCCLVSLPSDTLAAKKRLSRDELPIALAADAPLGDNLATASDSVIHTIVAQDKQAAAPLQKEQEDSEDANSSAVMEQFQSMIDDCDPDMIGFEIITG